MQITNPESLVWGITSSVRILGKCATDGTVVTAVEDIVVSGIAVLHVQHVVNHLALVRTPILELRIATDFAQPRRVGEFEGGIAFEVKAGGAARVNGNGLQARSDDLSHGTGVELVVLVHSSTVGASLESIRLELAVPFEGSKTVQGAEMIGHCQ